MMQVLTHCPAETSGAAIASAPGCGRRSLAIAKMLLFDVCERMFARRSEVIAERMREALRMANDRESLLAAAGDMLAEIEVNAGPECAKSIGDRIAMSLPPPEAMR